jgi:hypothetical protein
MFMRSRIAAFILFLTFAALPAAAQEFGPGLLPADTSFVIYSRGTAHAEASYPDNPAVKSWNSPEFAQLRQQGVNYFLRHSDWKVNGRPVSFTSANVEQIFSLLKSPMILGYSGSAGISSLFQASTPTAKQLMDAGGMFLIVDVTGKTAQFDLLFKIIEANIPKEIARTPLNLSGINAEKFTGPQNTAFAARVGNYFVLSSQQKFLQDLIARLSARSVQTNSLAVEPSFQRCRSNPDPDSVSEIYFRFPDLSKNPIPANKQFDTTAAMRPLHLDSIRAVCGSFAITQQGEHTRWAVLGDASAGGLFNVFGANRSHFDSLALAPASAYSYSVYSYDLPAIYNLVRSAAVAGLPQDQQAPIGLVEGMVGMQAGMPIVDVLGLISGEFATFQLDSGTHTPLPMYAITISDSAKVSSLIQKLGTNFVVEDSHDDGVTLYKYARAVQDGEDAKSSRPAAPQYYMAIAPHFLIVGTDKQMLRNTVKSGATPTSSSLASSAEITSLRAALPHDLLGLSVADYTHQDWMADMMKSLEQPDGTDKSKLSPEDIQFIESLKKFAATTVGKTLMRRSVAGWWKDTDGIHYEGFSQ